MGIPAKSGRPIKTIGTVFGVIETLRELGQAGVGEVAEELDIADSTAHDHLNSLAEKGYVVKEGQAYRLSLRFLDLGDSIRKTHPLAEVGQQPLEELADETNEVVWLITEENGYAVHLKNAVGRSGVQTHGRIGRYSLMHHLAAGKAILAHLPEERVDEIVDQHGLPKRTESTITDRDELFETLEDIRERGYSFNDEETYQGVRCVGAPIVVPGEGVLGAVSVCGPAGRFIDDRFREEIPKTLLGYTNEIELRISY